MENIATTYRNEATGMETLLEETAKDYRVILRDYEAVQTVSVHIYSFAKFPRPVALAKAQARAKEVLVG